MTRCYIFDIDGTVADLSHRLHHISNDYGPDGNLPKKDWNAFFAACADDTPIQHVIEMARDLAFAGKAIVYVSGRSDQCRFDTAAWLDKNRLPVGRLCMRKEGDHRPDNQVKSEILSKLLNDGYEPIMAFDDRDQVVKMWRERGIPCAQVADGNF